MDSTSNGREDQPATKRMRRSIAVPEEFKGNPDATVLLEASLDLVAANKQSNVVSLFEDSTVEQALKARGVPRAYEENPVSRGVQGWLQIPLCNQSVTMS